LDVVGMEAVKVATGVVGLAEVAIGEAARTAVGLEMVGMAEAPWVATTTLETVALGLAA
jgi:hypothetical protein